MRARVWTAFLLMAAVFTMHGLQCSAATEGPRAGHAMPTTATATEGVGRLADGPAIDHAVPAALEFAGLALTRSAVVTGEHPPRDGGHGTPRSDADHLWALCLAVLIAGIAVLLGLHGDRLSQVAREVRASGRARAPGGLPLPRSPDLSVLCVLRT